MPTLTIRKVPQELYDELKQRAAEHRRSLNSEVLHCIERALRSRRVDPEALLARLDALREAVDLEICDDDLRKARDEGRP